MPRPPGTKPVLVPDGAVVLVVVLVEGNAIDPAEFRRELDSAVICSDRFEYRELRDSSPLRTSMSVRSLSGLWPIFTSTGDSRPAYKILVRSDGPGKPLSSHSATAWLTV